jgi:hypothetical protein
MAMRREVKFSTSFPAVQTRSEVKKCGKVFYYEVRATGPTTNAKYIKLTNCKTCGNCNAARTEMFHSTHTHEAYTPLGRVGLSERAAAVQISKLPASVRRHCYMPQSPVYRYMRWHSEEGTVFSWFNAVGVDKYHVLYATECIIQFQQ